MSAVDAAPRRGLLRWGAVAGLGLGVAALATDRAEAAGASGVVHVDPAGSDANDGSSPDRAKLTVGAALAALPAGGGEVVLSAGTFGFGADLVLPGTGAVTIRGRGPRISHLAGAGAGLVAEQAERFTVRDLSVARTGVSGAAVSIRPGSSNGTRRFLLDNVHVTGSTGAGIDFSESWVATLVNVIVQGCQVGLRATVGPLFSSSANAVTIVGGELQGNGIGADIAGVLGWRILGTAIEGNSLGGLRFTGTSRSVHVNAYFEGNGGYDLWYDANPSGGYGLVIDSSTFLHTSASGARAIVVRRCQQVKISTCVFSAYPQPPVQIDETAAAVTSGWAENCRVVGTSTDAVEITAGTEFGQRRRTALPADKAAAAGVRTELGRVLVDLPGESATTLEASLAATFTTTTGSAYVGIIVTTAAGTVVATRAATLTATTGVGVATWSVDVAAVRGQRLLVGFRRIGENALDTHPTALIFLEGAVTVRHAHVL